MSKKVIDSFVDVHRKLNSSPILKLTLSGTQSFDD